LRNSTTTAAGTRRATPFACGDASSNGCTRLLQSPPMSTPAPRGLTPEIDALRREFELLADEADRLVNELTDDQFAWAPQGTSSRGKERPRWSIAQCIDHLNVTAREYLPQLDEGISNAIRQGQYSKGPFVYPWLARLFVKTLEPPPLIRL
jgi:hypothetical protein